MIAEPIEDESGNSCSGLNKSVVVICKYAPVALPIALRLVTTSKKYQGNTSMKATD
jgi:hypothetical protein